MADSNLEAFYAELDARMAMPDDGNWHNFSDHRRKYCIVHLPARTVGLSLFHLGQLWLVRTSSPNRQPGS
jgi:hypothetical protein